MQKHFIITIGRQYGSGGRQIGRRLAEMYSIPYYDKEILLEAARKSGLCPEFFEKADEKAPIFASMFSFDFGYKNALSPDSLFQIQSQTIVSMAAKSSCVIVGRCADYILRNEPGLVSIFIHAPMEVKVKNVMRYENCDDRKKVTHKIEKVTKSRAAYYNFFTDKKWGDGESYDISIDSSRLGVEATAMFLKEFIDKSLTL